MEYKVDDTFIEDVALYFFNKNITDGFNNYPFEMLYSKIYELALRKFSIDFFYICEKLKEGKNYLGEWKIEFSVEWPFEEDAPLKEKEVNLIISRSSQTVEYHISSPKFDEFNFLITRYDMFEEQ